MIANSSDCLISPGWLASITKGDSKKHNFTCCDPNHHVTQYHIMRLIFSICVVGGIVLDLVRAPSRSCTPVVQLEGEQLEAWDLLYIRADETPEIEATIGPTGGQKGYEAITGMGS